MDNPSSTTIGIIGGGQLGRMFIENALRYNVRFAVLENDENCPCAKVADHFIKGKLTDASAIEKLAEISDIITYEIEHLNTDVLKKLEASGKTIIPSGSILSIIQDKGKQKTFYRENGIPTADFSIAEKPDDWAKILLEKNWDRFVAKKCREGYDGKGVAILTRNHVLDDGAEIPFHDAAVLEEFIPCKKEISIIVARFRNGEIVSYPAIEMEFDPKANLVTWLCSPANISAEKEEEARSIAMKTIEAYGGPGLFAVEMLMDENDRILVNEVAPRPHNSGHHTIEACHSSQYDQLLRILMDMPAGNTELIQPAIMINLLGPEIGSGSYVLDGLKECLSKPGVFLHLYDKTETKPVRKLGHVTVVADTMEEARERANFVKNNLHIKLK